MFSRLRRPMCGRSSIFRKLGLIPRGYAPHVVRRTRSKQTGNRRASKTVFAKYKRGGHSPIKRNALAEGRRPSAHRAAEPRRKKTCVDTLGFQHRLISAAPPAQERVIVSLSLVEVFGTPR